MNPGAAESETLLRWVVDASVGIKLFIAEALSDRAHALFTHLAANPPAQLFVPDLFFIECTNVLWKAVRRVNYPPAKARRDLKDLAALTLRSVPTVELVAPALDLALSRSVTAYDACYVVLAQRLRVPFITADEKLARALAGTTAVHWLGDYAIPPLPKTG